MSGSRSLVPGGRGKRAGDVEVQAPSFVPSNLLTKKAMAFFRSSRHRAPSALLNLGFQRTEFSEHHGITFVTLYKAAKGASSMRFNPSSGNIATVLLPRAASDCTELAVFDTGRDRIGATRIPSPRSLDDPDSTLSRLMELAPEILKLAGRAAHVPQIGAAMAQSFPPLVEQARRQHGTAADESIRIANLDISLPGGSSCFMRTGRDDRVFDPPDWTDGVAHAERWQHVVDMLFTVMGDVKTAWDEFIMRPDMAKLSSAGRLVTERLVQEKLISLVGRSLEAFRNDMMWPLALRLLGLDDGAAQFVRRVADGRQP
jgi:hypothetical protein